MKNNPHGRLWEGAAREQGGGEPWVPHPPPRGWVWKGAAFPGTTFLGAGGDGATWLPHPPTFIGLRYIVRWERHGVTVPLPYQSTTIAAARVKQYQ